MHSAACRGAVSACLFVRRFVRHVRVGPILSKQVLVFFRTKYYGEMANAGGV